MVWTIRNPMTLTAAERQSWVECVQSNPNLESPYFRPEWWEAVGAVGRNVEVGVWQRPGANEPTAFLPYERQARRSYPVGRMISDYQGLVCYRNCGRVDLNEFLQAAGLKSFQFDHLPANQDAFALLHEHVESSPYADLVGGVEPFEAGLSKSGRDDIKTARRKGRKLSREVGPLTLDWASTDSDALHTLFEWKSKQYNETGVPDIFSHDWTQQLLQNLMSGGSTHFAGVLNTLHAGDRLAAIHFGLRTGGVLHWWFPTYDPDLSKFSPGRVLLQMLIDEAEPNGVHKIDFGKGMSSYKRRLMSGETLVAEGVLERPSVSRVVRQSAQQAKAWLKQTPLRGPLSIPARWVYQSRAGKAMQ